MPRRRRGWLTPDPLTIFERSDPSAPNKAGGFFIYYYSAWGYRTQPPKVDSRKGVIGVRLSYRTGQ